MAPPIRLATARAALPSLLAALVLACASDDAGNGPPPRPERLPQPTGTCLFTRTINDFRWVDSYRAVVFVDGRKRRYLVEFLTGCYGLRSAETIGFDTNDGQICDYRNDAILAGSDRCLIGAIRPYGRDEPAQPEDAYESEPGEAVAP